LSPDQLRQLAEAIGPRDDPATARHTRTSRSAWYRLPSCTRSPIGDWPSSGCWRPPAPLVPTLSIEVAPPALAGSAYFALTGNHVDALAYAIAGYSLLMVLVQITLLPVYMRTPFTAGFWSFTFPWTAVVAYALRWIAVDRPAGGAILGAAAVAAVTVLVVAS
jgi:tellurite resistance protein TehA-like permease